MNRRQQIVLFLIVVALMVTWLFPHWIPRYKEREPDSIVLETVYPRSEFYAFLFTESGIKLKIDWGRLLLTDLMIAAVGAPILYALRSKS